MRKLSIDIIDSIWAKDYITVDTITDQTEQVKALVHKNRGVAIAVFLEINEHEGFAQLMHVPSGGILFSVRGTMRLVCSIGHIIACLAPWETIENPAAFIAESPYTRAVLDDMMNLLPMIAPTRDDLHKIHKLARDYRLAKQASAGTA